MSNESGGSGAVWGSIAAWSVGIVVAMVLGPVLGYLGGLIENVLTPILPAGGRFGADPFYGYLGGWMGALYAAVQAGIRTKEAVDSRQA